MTALLRQFRGLAVALAVLAISAGAVFAAPSLSLTGSHSPAPAAGHETEGPEATDEDGATAAATGDPTTAPTATTAPTGTPAPAGTAAPTATASLSPTGSLGPTEAAGQDNHGALVSTAAQMPTPSGFPNHGSFVRCVAHMKASAVGFDWATVTPAACGIAPVGSASPSLSPTAAPTASSAASPQTGHGKSGLQHGKGSGHGANGK